MGFRFQKRIWISKGLTLNPSKLGTFFTVGGAGASGNVRGDNVTGTVGVSGTGLYYRQTLGGFHARAASYINDDRPERYLDLAVGQTLRVAKFPVLP
jgi:hypothetical protein